MATAKQTFDENAYSVRLFMPHGDPDGLRVIDQPNWSGVGIAFPRAIYTQVRRREETKRTGIYILVGPGKKDSALPMLYIGQSDKVKVRLDSHHKHKDFWEWAVFFVSKDNALNVAAAQHVESRLINLAKAAKRSHLDNNTGSAGPTLSDADTAEAEGFLRNILRILPILGLSAFESAGDFSRESDRHYLKLAGNGIEAKGYSKAGGFVVCKYSTATSKEVGSIHPSISTIRKDLVEQGILTPHQKNMIFNRDYELGSPSTAAGVLLGRSVNGRIAWKDEKGRTLKEIQEAEAQ